jgi:hypothetical protein
VVPHAAAGYLAVRSYTVLDRVFATEEPRDVLASSGVFLRTSRSPTHAVPVGRPLAASPQVLDVGNRRGASLDDHPAPRHRRGARQLGRAAPTPSSSSRFEHGTRRAAALRDPAEPRRTFASAAAAGLPRADQRALLLRTRTSPTSSPTARDPGASALKQAVSQLLGVRVDYYASRTCAASPISSTRSAASRST